MSAKFRSPSTNEVCTSAQYLAEVAVTRQYKRRKQTLPYKFWNIDKYKKAFVKEILKANSLLKIYDEVSVVSAFRKNEWITSLYVAKLTDLISEEADKRENQSSNQIEDVIEETKNFGEVSTGKQSIKSLLD